MVAKENFLGRFLSSQKHSASKDHDLLPSVTSIITDVSCPEIRETAVHRLGKGKEKLGRLGRSTSTAAGSSHGDEKSVCSVNRSLRSFFGSTRKGRKAQASESVASDLQSEQIGIPHDRRVKRSRSRRRIPFGLLPDLSEKGNSEEAKIEVTATDADLAACLKAFSSDSCYAEMMMAFTNSDVRTMVTSNKSNSEAGAALYSGMEKLTNEDDPTPVSRGSSRRSSHRSKVTKKVTPHTSLNDKDKKKSSSVISLGQQEIKWVDRKTPKQSVWFEPYTPEYSAARIARGASSDDKEQFFKRAPPSHNTKAPPINGRGKMPKVSSCPPHPQKVTPSTVSVSDIKPHRSIIAVAVEHDEKLDKDMAALDMEMDKLLLEVSTIMKESR